MSAPMSTKSPIDVAVVGEIYVDHVFSGFAAWPKPGEEVVTNAYTREIGGGAAATACGLARLGRSVSLVGLVGAIDRPWIGERLAQFGVSLENLKVGDGSTGVTISVSTAEDRSFFTHVGVNRQVGDWLNTLSGLGALSRARHVHFAMPLAHAIAAIILPALGAAGITTSLDMGYQPEWLADPANLPTLRAVDHLLLNEKEAELLCGNDAVEHFFDHAATIPLCNPMMKGGVRGAFLPVEAGSPLAVPPPLVSAIDATGAGDAFDAGFIHALLDGADPMERLRSGCVVGALSTRRPGALAALPDADELRSIYEQTYGS
jgi:sugar/nucleoside kinase (ribokinase family)